MFQPFAINVFGVKVNSIDRGFVSMGVQQLNDIFQNNKRNQGFGEHNGDFGVNLLPLNAINDTDATDANAAKGSVV